MKSKVKGRTFRSSFQVTLGKADMKSKDKVKKEESKQGKDESIWG